MNKTLAGAGLAAMVLVAATQATAASMFPTTLSGNNTGEPNATFLGAPDDDYLGLGGRGVVTYDFGPNFLVVNGAGVDINVYEVDNGVVEFNLMGIFVSEDDVTYTSIKASEAALVRITGDSVHGSNSFGRSYDLGAFTTVRYVRVAGTGSGNAGSNNGFDLDAIGAHQVRRVDQVPEPASSTLVLAGLAAIARLARRRR